MRPARGRLAHWMGPGSFKFKLNLKVAAPGRPLTPVMLSARADEAPEGIGDPGRSR
eukprot:CAMPEP_0202834266 /NCGR_PEP_ID=MMETSP1389-20130828/31352_1 /ASSEMBLY_ACC=CAM_ASM_000865 /TAXON_ID=302021 /ORGANISM="Rhodomonas sp., Strain CCMP768" /LENGTH=55 /DNA_ID=CAMNT_0049509381 /DNA_START=85 /DNA_END=249 /DNA_ORIENTATION=+